MPAVYQLNESGSVVLSASGGGTVKIGPGRPGTKWHVKVLAVSTSTAVAVPEARIYLGEPASGNLLGGTYTGSSDSTDLDVWIYAGQKLSVVWTGGDSGARATVSVYGELVG